MNILLTFLNVLVRRAGFLPFARYITLVQILLAAWNALVRAGLAPHLTLPGTRKAELSPSDGRALPPPPPPRRPLIDLHPAALLTLLAVPLGLRADQKYSSMPTLPEQPIVTPDPDAANPSSFVVRRSTSLPSLSIIIPARNEAKNLERLLPSLRALDYPGKLEIIVVDDQSSDNTSEVAARLGARVETVLELAAGWKGKPHACHVGALAAQGDWLLFTDADTVHLHDSALRAVSFADDHALDGLTLFLKQAAGNPFDSAVLMSAFAGLFAGVRDPNALINGQYILLRRNVYFASGGFESVHDQPLEDLALGHRLRKMGYRVLALNGETAATVRMYNSPRQMWHGMTRLGAGSLKWSGGGALVTALFTTALASPLLVLLGVATGGLRFVWLPLTWLAAGFSVAPFARRFGSVWLAALAPFGALFVLLASVWGFVTRVLGRGVHWRGRQV